jgi:hypothetical protein
LYIQRAEALGEPAEDPLLLFSVLYGFWASNYVSFNGSVVRELAAQFLALAEKQKARVPLMIGHRLMASSLMYTGEIVAGQSHFDRAFALYDPREHRSLATRFGQDVGVVILSFRSLNSWLLGYPEAAGAGTERVLKDAQEIGQAATLMYALFCANWTSTAEMTWRQAHTLKNLSRWRTKKMPFTGRRAECAFKAVYLP